MRKNKDTPPKPDQPIQPIQQRLKITWLIWLVYRLIGIAVLANILVNSKIDIVGGIAWQGLWLLPAIVSTPFILKGKSPYALLVIEMLTLIYLGGSGMLVLIHGFENGVTKNGAMMGIWAVDFVLLALINYWLFVLLKRLPKMNG